MMFFVCVSFPICSIGIVYSLHADEAIKVGIRFIQMFYNRMKENSKEVRYGQIK